MTDYTDGFWDGYGTGVQEPLRKVSVWSTPDAPRVSIKMGKYQFEALLAFLRTGKDEQYPDWPAHFADELEGRKCRFCGTTRNLTYTSVHKPEGDVVETACGRCLTPAADDDNG